MRLPKFRCKNKAGNWCFFTVLHNGNVNEENFDLSTLSEFTGLLDKQGVEIYEHDLMFEFNHTTRKYDAVGIVTFGNFSAEIYDCKGWFLADKNGNQISEAGLDDDFSGVIGNIHDNPELLNAQ